MRAKKDKKIFALYKGDTFIDVGSLEGISKRQNMRKETLLSLKTPYYINKIKDKEDCLFLIKVDDEE